MQLLKILCVWLITEHSSWRDMLSAIKIILTTLSCSVLFFVLWVFFLQATGLLIISAGLKLISNCCLQRCSHRTPGTCQLCRMRWAGSARSPCQHVLLHKKKEQTSTWRLRVFPILPGNGEIWTQGGFMLPLSILHDIKFNSPKRNRAGGKRRWREKKKHLLQPFLYEVIC